VAVFPFPHITGPVFVSGFAMTLSEAVATQTEKK